MRLFTILVALLWTCSITCCSYKEASKVHVALEVGLHQHGAEQDNPLPQMSADAGADAPQDVAGIFRLPSTQPPQYSYHKLKYSERPRSRDAWLELPISRCHKVYVVVLTVTCDKRDHQQAGVVLNAAAPLCSQSPRNTHML